MSLVEKAPQPDRQTKINIGNEESGESRSFSCGPDGEYARVNNHAFVLREQIEHPLTTNEQGESVLPGLNPCYVIDFLAMASEASPNRTLTLIVNGSNSPVCAKYADLQRKLRTGDALEGGKVSQSADFMALSSEEVLTVQLKDVVDIYFTPTEDRARLEAEQQEKTKLIARLMQTLVQVRDIAY